MTNEEKIRNKNAEEIAEILKLAGLTADDLENWLKVNNWLASEAVEE